MAHFRITVKIFLGPAPSQKTKKKIWNWGHDQGKDEEEERLIEMSDCTVQYNIPAGEVYKDQADHSHDQGEDEE